MGSSKLIRMQHTLRTVTDTTLSRNKLAEIYDQYHELIYRHVYRQVGDIETARDLTAEVFHRLIISANGNQAKIQHISAWLYRTAHNLVIDHYRRQQYRQHLEFEDEIAVSSSNPAESAERLMAATRLRNALNNLTQAQRQVIILKFLDGKSNHEVAEILDKPVGAVKSLQHRGLVALHKILATSEESIL